MLPLSVRDIVRFTPLIGARDDLRRALSLAETEADRDQLSGAIAALEERIAAQPQPVYLLAVPSVMQRAAFRRDLFASGASYPGDAQLFAALRDDLRAVAPGNLGALLDVVDEVEAANGAAVAPDARTALEAIERLARELAGSRFAALEGARAFWNDAAPVVACRHFLTGWENVDAAFERRNALTTDAALDALVAAQGEAEFRLVGAKIISLMSPSRDAEKNFASPSPSASSRKRTAAAKTRRTGRNGISSANATAKTRASA